MTIWEFLGAAVVAYFAVGLAMAMPLVGVMRGIPRK